MATTDSTLPVNGNYGHQAYESSNFASSAHSSATYVATPQPAPATAAAASDIPKDEVGWYFVEQYYTTLSKTPERLWLFYNKRSQYVSGTEEDKIQVCVGSKAINDQIKNLDFHDTKVRVTNVDSQGSDEHIVIQVIGELSNRGQPHKKFVQTFVLAEQTNGYFVLNDIVRYLAEESDDAEELSQEPEETGAQEPAPSTITGESEPVIDESVAKSEEDLVKVDIKLEEVVQEESAPEAAPAVETNGTPVPEAAEAVPAEEAPAAVEETPAAAEAASEPTAEGIAAPEKPAEPAHTPAPAAQKPAAPAAPAAPSKPKSWAALAASAHTKVALPSMPSSSTAPAPSQPKAASQTPAQAAPAAQSSTPAREASPVNSQGEAAGWQSVTGHKKEQSRAQNQAPAAVSESKRGYIKNVYSQVEEEALKEAMQKFGELQYFDVSRPKNCAFVDFKSLSSFQAAVAANPHTINGIELTIEERRMRPQQSFSPFPRGGAPRSRGGPGNGRGGFNPRGGRGGAVRGGRPPVTEA